MSPIKILLISADSALAHSVTTCLRQAGYKVIQTARGLGAIELIRSEDTALVILDIGLPDYNSLAIIRSVRAEKLDHRIPIILIGSQLTEEDVLIGFEVGADLCLRETFHPQVFVARLRSLLRRQEMARIY